MAAKQRWIPGSRLHPHTHELNKWESWGNRTRESPPETRVQIHYDKINAFGTRYGHAVAVVKHQGEWWWWTQRTRKWQSTEDWKRLRNTASRTRDELIVHRQGRAPDNTCVSIKEEAELWLGAHLTRQKTRNGHSQAETARLTTIRQQRAVRTAINAARRQISRWQPNSPPELAAKQHQPNTHLNPSRKPR
jgi:hypothetical protein